MLDGYTAPAATPHGVGDDFPALARCAVQEWQALARALRRHPPLARQVAALPPEELRSALLQCPALLEQGGALLLRVLLDAALNGEAPTGSAIGRRAALLARRYVA